MDAGESGVRKHGFKAILKGSLLCLDHDIRYMVHGRKGSWVKKGVDLQEERIMSGNMPTYPTGCVQREPEHLWGTLTGLDGSRILTPTSVSSYHFLYDSLYSSIIDCTRPFISGANVIAVIKLINMAFESSRLGAVLPV